MDSKNEGKINKGQIRGLLTTHGSRNMVPESEIRALMRRLDHDQDGEVSFTDFFNAFLPYFVNGNLKSLTAKNPLVVEASKPPTLSKKLLAIQMKTKSGLVPTKMRQ